MESKKQHIDSGTASIKDIRQLRWAADTLEDTANLRRVSLIQRLGLKRYIFNSLGQAAHLPASGTRLVWAEGVELIDGVCEKLGEYLYIKCRGDQSLPQAILVDGEKFYL